MARYAVFTVQRTQALNTAVSVDYETVDGTAIAANGDYTPETGALAFAPGEASKEVRVPIRDTDPSESLSFTLRLSNPYRVRVDRAEGTANIPAGAGGLESIFVNRNLNVLFYAGEKHPSDGGGLSDTEWAVAPLPATQDDPQGNPTETPFPNYMGQFNLNAGPFAVRGGEGPIETLSGWWLHYLVADQGGTTVIQILFGTSPVVPPDQKLDPALATDFNAWWDAKGEVDMLLLDASDTILKRTPLPLPTTHVSEQTDATTYRAAVITDLQWPQNEPEKVAMFRIVPRED